MHTLLLLVVGLIVLTIGCAKKDTAVAERFQYVGWRFIALALLIPIGLILVLMVLSFLDKYHWH